MDMKKTLLLVTAALGAGLITDANAETTTTGFGTIPGAPANAYSGTGIPINTSEWTKVSGIPGSSGDDLTLAMAATQHGSANPAPGNNGAGTYTVNPGLVSGRSKWDFDFYINSADDKLSDYTFTLTELNVGNGKTFSFNPLAISDNAGGPASAGNSESLDFAVFGLPISYNPSANDTYDFTLRAVLKSDGDLIGNTSIKVVDGTGAVPDTASTAGLMVAMIPLLAFGKRRLARSS
jgi:hypothetical protein